VILVTGACAKMGSLAGGPMDEAPPEVVKSDPENYSTNFDGQTIEITFDEFIQLDNVNQNLVISPPLENRPDVRLRKTSIVIELENELRENTTYTLNFGSAIKDNNEGNELTNYEFVFSTGNYLDSLSIGGNILQAFNLQPTEEPVHVMLYENLSDSVVYKELPVYIGKSTKEGTYRINNIKEDTFKLFALDDVNNNFLFDLPNEQIAFLDTSIILTPELFSRVQAEEADTLHSDSLNIARDTLAISDTVNIVQLKEDSLLLQSETALPERLLVDLFLFTEDSESQFLSDYNRETRKKLDFSFNLPVSDSFHYESILPGGDDWFLEEKGEENKNFTLWLIDEEVIALDTISFLLSYAILDSTHQPAWKRDTLNFTYRQLFDEEEKQAEALKINTIKNRAILDLNAETRFIAETPLKSIDTSYIEFYKTVDTLEYRESYNMYLDTGNIRTVVFDKAWEPETRYHFCAYPGAFIDYYDATNDSLETEFSVREEEYYGSLIVKPDTVLMPMIFQLLNTNDELLEEQLVNEKQELTFDFLEPSNYKLKLVYDRNANGEWDTGDYSEDKQPEKVQYYEGDINIRANWELGINITTLKDLPGI
jgi:hypothetical protein